MHNILVHTHSGLRWLVLLLAVYALYNNYSGWKSGRSFMGKDKGINAAFIGSLHLQLLIGLILYFISPTVQLALSNMAAAMKDRDLRFWAVEHITGMIVGIAIAQIGSIKSKKQTTDTGKFKTAFTWFAIGIVIIVLMIPFGIWNPARPMG